MLLYQRSTSDGTINVDYYTGNNNNSEPIGDEMKVVRLRDTVKSTQKTSCMFRFYSGHNSSGLPIHPSTAVL